MMCIDQYIMSVCVYVYNAVWSMLPYVVHACLSSVLHSHTPLCAAAI